jgi:hypothetical protein
MAARTSQVRAEVQYGSDRHQVMAIATTHLNHEGTWRWTE